MLALLVETHPVDPREHGQGELCQVVPFNYLIIVADYPLNLHIATTISLMIRNEYVLFCRVRSD